MKDIPTMLIGAIAFNSSSFFGNLMVISLPLAVNDAFWALCPFIVALFVRMVLGETVNTPTLIAMSLSFAAVVGLAKFKPAETEEEEDTSEYTYTTGLVFAMLCVSTYSVSQVVFRKLQDVHVTLMLQFFTLVSIPFFLLWMAHNSLKDDSRMFKFTSEPGSYWVWLLIGFSNTTAVGLEAYSN